MTENATETVEVWEPWELVLTGAEVGNPFLDVDLRARLELGERVVEVGGFADGASRHLVRAVFDEPGVWTYRTTSNVAALDGIEGSVEVVAGDRPGPVRVDGFHFRTADGARYRPVGTTAYAWIHQSDDLRAQTLETLASTPFTKLRMTVFPKWYPYNEQEPPRHAFPVAADGGWDLQRFDVSFFRALDDRVAELAALGVQADVILLHPYDRWGCARLDPLTEERYLRYVIRRLAAWPHVWWSLANEFDLMPGKTDADWERIAAIVAEEDPWGHLTSIHHCLRFYDQSRPWITHVSAQRIDRYRTAENVDAWREQWGKPVVVDECGYEGDIEHGWGNLTAQELVRRAWEGAVRGGYVGHGETYRSPDEVLWWSKGGRLRGDSAPRLAFLDEIVGSAPGGAIDPLPSEWDLPVGGVAGTFLLAYFGGGRSSFRTFVLPEGTWRAEVIDTWNMTVTAVAGEHAGSVRVDLPAREFMAVRLTEVGGAADGRAREATGSAGA